MSVVGADYDGTFDYLSPDDRDSVDIIITGNGYDQYSRLYNDGVRIPIFWNPDKNELMEIVNHKANIINKVGVEVYYEDQPMQVTMLKALCPKCKIIRIMGGEK